MKNLIAFVLLSFFYAAANLASAAILTEVGPLKSEAGFPWTQVATTCSIDDSDLSIFDAVRTNPPLLPIGTIRESYLTYKGANVRATGVPLVSRCNVDNILNGGRQINGMNLTLSQSRPWNSLIVTYQDPDGAGQNYSVTVNLYQVLRTTGNTSLITSFNSNSRAYTDIHEIVVNFNHNWNFFTTYYYVELQLVRKDALANPRIYDLRLTHLFDVPT